MSNRTAAENTDSFGNAVKQGPSQTTDDLGRIAFLDGNDGNTAVMLGRVKGGEFEESSESKAASEGKSGVGQKGDDVKGKYR
ncbi:hypothetical protein M011DRAFT_477135 [Sporormia fimetaria CBS 119925]|uniref:Uncharacterized protein n=1 Tax=Sporormia fimetaria CBS 119925 TaxID=1340428 RepID=A0A6A6VED4_9PLEO|nr:hypothetical protein M011DRAFT_477135 [Sporormia fimetaria CBS 119925]